MLSYLQHFADQVAILNVFRYITFRTGAATMTALIFVFLFGPAIIRVLRIKQGQGQPIRDDGPQTHFKKAGTPTMGGLMILLGVTVSALLWADLTNYYVWSVLAIAPSMPPSASEPVSPMKIAAGGALNHRKPRPAPISAPQSTASSPVPLTLWICR